MPGFPVHLQLPELDQTHVHGVGDAIQPSLPVIPFSSCPQSFPTSGSFPMSQFFTSGGQSIGASASASVLPISIKDRFPLGLTDLISLQSKGLSKVFFSTTVILYIENPKDSTRKLLELINEYSKVAGYKINRNPLHSYTLTMRKQKEKLRKQYHSPLQQKE